MKRREFIALVVGSLAGAMAASARAGAQQLLSQGRTTPPPQPVPQVTPQLNAPGPQAAPPQPGNPVQQLAPLGGTSPSVRAGRTRNLGTVRSRRRAKRRQAE
jgi:hypothetical protein